MVKTTQPPTSVLEAFGLTSDILHMPGGQGESFRCGDAVLKREPNLEEAKWSSQVFHKLLVSPYPSFRIPRPLPTASSKDEKEPQFVFSGWTAYEFVPGVAEPEDRWKEILETSRALHGALRNIPCPVFLRERQHIWAIAYLVAWDEGETQIDPSLQDVYDQLLNLRQEVHLASQIVHGDLAGNILFSNNAPPDFSPFWRPVKYAEAIVVADALLDHGKGVDMVMWGGEGDEWMQMLVRALIFRLVAWSGYVGAGGVRKEYVKCFERAFGIISVLGSANCKV